jgi:single-strand DNA-binding protein
MANFNKVLLMGNLTRDPELRFAGGGARNEGREGGGAICKFGLAVNRQWRNQAGEKQEEVCFVDIVVFGRQAENCNEYLRKGRPVFIEGRLHYDSWDDRETGKKRNRLEVVAEVVQFLGSRDGAGAPGAGAGAGGPRREEYRDEVPAASGTPSSGTSMGSAPRNGKPSAGGDEVNFDDIPF